MADAKPERVKRASPVLRAEALMPEQSAGFGALPPASWAGVGSSPILMGSGKAMSQTYSAANLFSGAKG